MSLTRARAKRIFGKLVSQRHHDTVELSKVLCVPADDLNAIKAGKGIFDSKLVKRIVDHLNMKGLVQRYCKVIFAQHKRHQGSQWSKGTVKGSGKIRRRCLLKR